MLAVLAARRSVLAREMTRLERRARGLARVRALAGIEADPPVLGRITALQSQLASLESRVAELDRAVAGLARIRGNPARAGGHSTDGDPVAAA